MIMRKSVLALFALPLTCGAAFAQSAGDAARGEAYWSSPLHACRNCHGPEGQGAFGPDLAGRGLNAAQVGRAVHQPWGIMPAFTQQQLSDQDAADLAAYFAGKPKPAEPGKWRFEAEANMPAGQQMLINMGCGQCHTPNFQGPRGNLGAVNADFDLFSNLVYNHTTALPAHRRATGIGNPNGNLDMGNYNRTRVTESDLRAIFDWAKNQIGFRPPLQAQVRPGAQPGTYTVNVVNNGVAGQGLTAQGITVDLQLPAGVTLVNAGGAQQKGNTAEWAIATLAPKQNQTYTITLSRTAQRGELKGTVHWATPKPSPDDVVNIAFPNANPG
jgi:mono/diheme cytochrome c family protein